MAPEQVLGVRNDIRSDIFALGVLMYFFASDVRPFGDPQKLKGLKQRLWRDPVPLLKIKSDTPPWFQEIVLRCLEVNAARRPQTAPHLAFDLINPSQVELTERSRKIKQDSFFTVLKRKSEPESALIDRPAKALSGSVGGPIIMVAIDLNGGDEELDNSLRQTVQQILARLPNARLACVNVLKLARIALDSSLDAEGNNKHLNFLVKLKNWVHPLGLDVGRATFHVLEAVDPAEAILEFARMNNADQIIMGARANSGLRKILGGVSGRVAAEAPCTVTVVRNRGTNTAPHFSERAKPS
jgi:nucleotide-binding universal stress UspA family protein